MQAHPSFDLLSASSSRYYCAALKKSDCLSILPMPTIRSATAASVMIAGTVAAAVIVMTVNVDVAAQVHVQATLLLCFPFQPNQIRDLQSLIVHALS